MSDTDQNEPCPCGSGLTFGNCCGVPGRQAASADVMLCVASDGTIAAGEPTPQLQTALDTIDRNPDLFPARIAFAKDKAWFVKMSPRWYRESVFLDPGRIKGTYVVETDIHWLQAVCDRIAWQTTGFIFHTAFCGSTLMAQALEALFRCLPLREPEALGNVQYYLQLPEVTREQKQAWFERVLRLLSRRYEADQGVVVKANDFANPVMIEILKWNRSVPLLFMYTPLREFVAGCVKIQSRREWIHGRYQSIKSGAQTLLNMAEMAEPAPEAYGEMAAIYWSYNIAWLLKARAYDSTHLRTLDFNHMLERPLEAVQACGQLLGLQPLADVDVTAEMEKLFGVYSKNNTFNYSPQQRSQDIERILAENKTHLDAAETLAQRLLGDDYPQQGLPGSLI
jgi:hypothetical protein